MMGRVTFLNKNIYFSHSQTFSLQQKHLETWRSGSEPMSTMGQTGLDCQSPQTNLVVAQGRDQNRPDSDPRRNCLTSIYWVPTTSSSTLLLASNLSDHVHYYQGGKPFQYILFDPENQILEKVILGPELHKGHLLQVPVKGGMWKCGHMLHDNEEEEQNNYKEDYTIIGEAVAPGKLLLQYTHLHSYTMVLETHQQI